MQTGKTGPLPKLDAQALAAAQQRAAAEAARRAAEAAAKAAAAAEATAKAAAGMKQDSMKLIGKGAEAAVQGQDGLPWEQGNAVGQFWDHSCGSATMQQNWANNDPAGYTDARKELETTGKMTLANGESVALTPDEQAYIEDNFPEGDRADAAVQYAIMKHAQSPLPEGTSPEQVANGQAGDKTGGLTQSEIARANEATAGMPMVNSDELTTRADDGFIAGNTEESGMSQQELRSTLEENRAGMRLRELSEENGGGGVVVTLANQDGTAHVVTATPKPDGMIEVVDGQNPPVLMTEAEFQVAVDGQQGSGTFGTASSTGTSGRGGR